MKNAVLSGGRGGAKGWRGWSDGCSQKTSDGMKSVRRRQLPGGTDEERTGHGRRTEGGRTGDGHSMDGGGRRTGADGLQQNKKSQANVSVDNTDNMYVQIILNIA